MSRECGRVTTLLGAACFPRWCKIPDRESDTPGGEQLAKLSGHGGCLNDPGEGLNDPGEEIPNKNSGRGQGLRTTERK